VALVGVVLGGSGCVKRTLAISSEPAGALVWVNDQEVGRTPVEVPFTWYGTYDVRLEREGYAPLWTVGEAQMPWWELPGPDLVAELIPGAESRVAWHYELEKRQHVDEAEALPGVLERARGLREDTRMFEEQ
jgi:hypothetical protein